MPADVLALFDLDRTLLSNDCDEAWIEFLIGQGVLDRAEFEERNRAVVDRYRRGIVGTLEYTEFYVSTLARHSTSQLGAWHAEYMRTMIMPAISAAARELVHRHIAQGDLTVLTTAANRFLTEPIAREFGFEHLISTEPQIRHGAYTGKIMGTPNMREGKIARLEAWLESRGLRFSVFRRSWFYSDSRNDIPLLSRVTDPVAVNPDSTLEALAAERGWPVLRIG
ncbi:MAG: HAD family hydrolase [Betaproteobacteria bacterium]|nr:MAG: HAD family hydrolase [Betaproteobacteria bacterium]